MKHILLSFLCITLLLISTAGGQSRLDPVIEEKIDSIINIMTSEEKAGQLNQLSFGIGWGPEIKSQVPEEYKQMIRDGKIGSFLNAIGAEFTEDLQKTAVNESRMKIPLLFGFDVIHGFKTTFPVPLAEVSSWDPEIVEKSARYQALEASSVGIHWTFAPMLDIARDPRWGRIVEGAGEDTYLGSVMAAARVRGYQGDLSNKHILACAKHFAAYGAAEGGRDYNTVDMSERTLREIYLPPFKAAIDAGVHTFMSSFNEIGGIPSTSSKFLLSKILREEWKFDGFVVSDWNSVGELIPHGQAVDAKDAALKSLNAGTDMDMESRAYLAHITELVNDGSLDIKTVDEAVRRILRVKFKLGLFDNPYKYNDKQREKSTVMNSEMQEAALDVARKSIVLLKNSNNILPLSKNIKTIAVIGPLANSRQHPLGSWEQLGDSNDVVTLVEGIKIASPGSSIIYAEGCSVNGMSKEGFAGAVDAAKQADVVILALGEEGHMSGEARSRSTIDLPGVQEELAQAVYNTGKPVAAVLMNGRPLAVGWLNDNVDAIVEAWFLGIKSGNAIADVLFGNYNPSGKLPVTFPRTTGQIPMYYNHKSTGRPGSVSNNYSSKYIDLPLTPLYSFGFGLSYTTFEYSDIMLSNQIIKYTDTLKVTVDVKNTGSRDGEEVVQLYIKDIAGSTTRPVKELKAFKKILLKPGESRTIEFLLTDKDLSFYDENMNFTAEPGMFKVYAGTNSEVLKEAEFELAKR